MKQTPFTEIHKALGAKMHEFAGYNMPIEYSGIIDEHLTVCNAVGVFDVSHMGEFWVRGPKAMAFLQKITVNDVSALPVGKAQYTCFTNENGGVIDDLLIYRMEEDKYMLVVNASNIEKDWNWCKQQNTENAILENASNHTAQLAIQGPEALSVLQTLTDVDLSAIPYYSVQTIEIAGIKDVIVSNTGYTGAGGFELYFFPSFGKQLWNAIFDAGKDSGIKPIGLGARDTLRLEMGYCLYGHELNETTTPLEAGLGWITKFSDNKDFIGRQILEKQKQEGVKKRLCGFVLQERGVPRQGYQIVEPSGGEVIGEVTSGTLSPTTKEGFGLAYIESKYATINTAVCVRIRNKDIPARIVKPPFRKNG